VIVKMSKLTLIGLEDQREALFNSLMELGAVEINEIDEEEYGQLAHHPSVNESATAIGNDMSDVHSVLESLNQYCPKKKGFFQGRREITDIEFRKVVNNEEKVRQTVKRIKELEDELVRIKAEENRLNNTYSSLLVWEGLEVPLETEGTGKTSFQIGTLPSAVSLETIGEKLAEKVPCSLIEKVSSDKDQHYICVISHRDEEQEALSFLKAQGYNRVTFSGMKGTVSENLAILKNKFKELSERRSGIISLIRDMANERETLEIFYDYLSMEQKKTEALGKILKTDRIFMIKGWIPEKLAGFAKNKLEESYTVSVDIMEPGEDEEFPVLLENRGIAEAGEPVSKMYSLPHCREIDPNAVMAPFFIMFFGLMLSDGGYGLILAIASAIILRLFKLEEGTRKFMKLIFYCGLSTIFWGIMFGGWFGIEALAKYGVWLNPIEEPELLLSWSLLFGVIHMYAGFALNAANLIRKKKYLDALMDVGSKYILYTGFLLVLLPYAPKVDPEAAAPLVNAGKYVLLAGVAITVLTQGRSKKNIIMKIFGGVASLYDVIGFMSDVLSYSRLLALGLATGIIASIVNQMSVMFDFPVIIKIIMALAILAVGHVINLAINALGAYVHSCRLQYLEFFGKFFTGGGQAFKPLKANTKYTVVKSEAVK